VMVTDSFLLIIWPTADLCASKLEDELDRKLMVIAPKKEKIIGGFH
jgi:hypothetical protein